MDISKTSPDTTDRSTRVIRRTNMVFWGFIVGMVVVWSAVILSRNVIRAHWWAYRLAATESPQERLVYFHRLVNLGPTAVPAVSKLLVSNDPGLRSFAVGVLHHARCDRATALLLQACRDEDTDVARLAIQGIALRRDEQAVRSLASIAKSGEQHRAMMATAALADTGSTQAEQVLIDLLQSTRQTPVRIEVIECLASLQTPNAIEPLINLLDDDSVYEGVTEQGMMAARVFEAVRSQEARSLDGIEDRALVVEEHHVVWRCADRALRAITGHSPDLVETEATDRLTVARAWRDWWAQTQQDHEPALP